MGSNLVVMQDTNVKEIVQVSEGKKELTVYLDNLALRLQELEDEIVINQAKMEDSFQKSNRFEKELESLISSRKNMKSEASIVSLNEFIKVKDQIKKDVLSLDKEQLMYKQLSTKSSILNREIEFIKEELNKTEKRVSGYGKLLEFRKIG